jgi:hypothetical protein
MKPNALWRGDSAFIPGPHGPVHVRVVHVDDAAHGSLGATVRFPDGALDWCEWSELSHAVPFALRLYAPDGSLSAIGRAIVQRRRDAEPARLSNRRRRKLYAAALREDRAYSRAALEAADARLLSYAY